MVIQKMGKKFPLHPEEFYKMFWAYMSRKNGAL
jgi:hypothetical protein